ncbi:MAG: diguanylate cyclase/phosphodiesterase with sensor [Frankiales bacterium]|nr:diguanylate cyclase/phosphodiesterase with sensor [Frankiales bacterium]
MSTHGPDPERVLLRQEPPVTCGVSAAVRPLLRLAAEQAGLDGCVLVRQQGARWVVLETSDPVSALPVGLDLPWQDTLCAAVVDGRSPCVVPDVTLADPALRRRAAGFGMVLGAYVSFPLHDDAGRLLGSLCGWSDTPRPALARAEPLLRALADACGELLGAELALTASQARGDLFAPDADLGRHTGLLHDAAWARQLRHHDERCARLGATCSVLLVEVRASVSTPEVLLALLEGLRDGDSVSRTASGALALLLVDVGADEARRRASQLGTALARAGVAHRSCTATAAAGRRLQDALPQAELRLRRAVWTPGSGAPEPEPAERVRQLLDSVRCQLGQEVAFLSELTAGEQVFRHVVAPAGFPVQAGHRKAAAHSLCRRIVDGDLPGLMSDAAQHPSAREVAEVQAGLVGSYLAAPVRLSDGRVYGTLCCLSSNPTPGLTPRHAVVLQVVADALGVHVEAELEATSERRQAHDGLAALLASGGPQSVFQPVVATDGLGVVGVEALTRFPDGRSPLSWFLEAARHGTGVQLELAACRSALAALPELAASGRFLAVNLSPAAIADPALAELLAGVQAEGMLESLVVEITEHEAVHDYDALNRLLAPWRAAGLRLAVDDTGAGHSSLRHVLLLEPDVIKLDRELVTAVQDDRTRADLIASLVAFADRSGRALVAEGVETAAELACLTRLGVHLVQGFHLARPTAELVLEVAPPAPVQLPAPRLPRAAAAGLRA